MKITAQDLLRFGIIDAIVPEPPGGAHRDHAQAIRSVADQKSGMVRYIGFLVFSDT